MRRVDQPLAGAAQASNPFEYYSCGCPPTSASANLQGPVDDSMSEFPHQQPTIAQKLRQLHGESNVVLEPGITFSHRTSEARNVHDASGRAAALAAAAGVDVVVLVFGEEIYGAVHNSNLRH